MVSGLYGAVADRFTDIHIHGIHRRNLLSSLPAGVVDERIGKYLTPGLWRRLAVPLAARRPGNYVIHFPWNGGVPNFVRGLRRHDNARRAAADDSQDILRAARPMEGYRQQTAVGHRPKYPRCHGLEFSKQEIMNISAFDGGPVVIPCATSIGDFAEAGGAAEKRYFLYVGGLDPRKSVDGLLQVFLQPVRWREKSLRHSS